MNGKTSLAKMIVLFFHGNGYKRNASSTCTVASISNITGVTSTNIRSIGVRAGSIYVTRVISFTLVNIWKIIKIIIIIIIINNWKKSCRA